MALDPTALAAEMKAKVQAKNPEFLEKIGESMNWLFEALAEAVVEHVQANAEVAFDAGQIAGADSMGGTHELLTASGGTIA
jgi:hypothetical protein